MSPIEYIEEGIRKVNWGTVCKGYEKLTGKALSIPVTSTTGAIDAIRKISEIASDTLREIKIVSPEGNKSVSKKRGRPKASKTKNKEKSSLLDVNKRTTTQRDLGKVQLITNEPDPEEVEQNKIRAKKSGRSKRKPPVTYEVECNECEKPFQSSRQGGDMGQKCSKCLRAKKSEHS